MSLIYERRLNKESIFFTTNPNQLFIYIFFDKTTDIKLNLI